MGSPSLNQGNKPWRYAFKRRGMDKSAPAATKPLLKAISTEGNGLWASIQGIEINGIKAKLEVFVQTIIMNIELAALVISQKVFDSAAYGSK